VTIFIPGHVAGFDKDIIVDDDKITVSTATKLSDDMWHLCDKAHRSISRIGDASSRPVRTASVDPRIAWWSSYTDRIRYDHVLGKKLFTENIKRIIADCKNALNANEYFLTQYQVQNLLIDKIDAVYADKSAVHLVDENDSSALMPDELGKCKIVEYDNYSSSTGRMSVKSGPKIMTLDKRLRHVFRSKWGIDGELISIDYSALEPRVIMTLMGEKDLPQDIYASIGDKIQDSRLQRSTLKLMILSVLYGMSRKNFIVKFIETPNPDVIYDRLQDALCVKSMLKKIKSDVSGDQIANYYGRPLKCDNESLFVNHYTQSTAVDVACDGFLKFVQDNPYVRPVFLLHDEMVVDIHKDDLEKLTSACKNGLYIPSLKTNFYTTMKVFNGRKDHQ